MMLSLIILFVEPVFQKLLDPSLFGDTFYVFGFDRVKSNLVIIASYLLLLLSRRQGSYPQQYKSPVSRFVFAVIVFHIFNVLFSYNIGNSVAISIVAILGPILFFFVLLRMPDSAYLDDSSVLKSIYASVIVFICIGLFLYNNTLLKGEAEEVEILRTGGGMWLSNISTQVLALFFPFAFSEVKFKGSRILRLIVIILFIVLMIISMSRTGLVIYLVMLIMIFYKAKRKILWILTGTMMVALTLNFGKDLFNIDIIELYSERFFREGNALETVETDSRLSIYEESFKIVKGNEIMGTGISTFNKLNEVGFSNAHNIFINVFVERGIIGLILLLVFISFFFLVNSSALKLYKEHKAQAHFIRLARVGFIGFFLIGLTGNDMFINSGFINGWATYIMVFLLAFQLKKIHVFNKKRV